MPMYADVVIIQCVYWDYNTDLAYQRPARLDVDLHAMTAPSLLIRKLYNTGHTNHDVPVMKQYNGLNEADVLSKCVAEEIPLHALEHYTQGPDQAVALRRRVLAKFLAITGLSGKSLAKLPHQNYNWDLVVGSYCENVIGYMPVPVGVAGPVLIDSKNFFIPMATTEGALIASTNRGCKAINNAGGVTTNLTDDGITRGPCVQFPGTERAAFAKNWISSHEGQVILRDAFESTSNIAKLRRVNASIAGRSLYIRFKATTGDAMGMNMISKGVENALRVMSQDPKFEDMRVVSLSGNYCTDKKASALNWIEGRGKSVVAEAVIPHQAVQSVLKCTAEAMVRINNSKNLVGSAMAGVIGGYNAHAANIVAAIFIATGQDPAQVVESANCITLMECNCVDNSLRVSVTMPSLEVGTVGGGHSAGAPELHARDAWRGRRASYRNRPERPVPSKHYCGGNSRRGGVPVCRPDEW
ncbi:Hydroxymethylglutaryl-CoA reductase, class I/II, partial [Metarhizium brunneum ARSEF 3297]